MTTRPATHQISGSDSCLGPREVARLTGVSTDTLRHYEAKGVLRTPLRTAAGYRRYPAAAVAQVQMVQRALAIGFSLDDLAQVLRERDHGGAPCRRVHHMVTDRLADLDRQLAELGVLRAELSALLEDWKARLAGTPPGTRAYLLDALAGKTGLVGRPGRRRSNSFR